MRIRLHILKSIANTAVAVGLAACSVESLTDVDRIFDSGSSSSTTALNFTPVTYDFGLIAAGTGSASHSFTIGNSTGSSVFISSVSGTNTDFTLATDDCPRTPFSLASGSSCQATVVFAPQTSGAKSLSLAVVFGLTVADSSLSSSMGISGTGVSSLSFAGIDSITSVTAATLTVNWTHVAGAVRYFVYTVNGGTLTYVTDVTAPAPAANLTGLTPGTAYTFRVRALDALGVWDSNTNDVMVTTLNPGTFTAIATLASAEGGTSFTPNLSCTNGYGDTPAYSVSSQSDSDVNCSISAAPERVVCSPAYKTGHSGWSATVVARCDLNGQVLTNSFLVNVADTNRAPTLAAVSNQTIPILSAMASVNVADSSSSADTDSDGDVLSYSCTFTKDGGAVTACSSAALTGTYSLNTSTGVVDWTPGSGAITGENTSVYVFTITGSDQQGAPLTGTTSFTINVTPISPVMTAVSDYTFALGTQLTVGATLSLDFNNVRDGAPGNDTSMTYACVFDKLVDGAVASGTACTSLYGMTFNTATGAFNWVTDFDATGVYEFKVTGTNVSTLSGSRIFIVDVRPGYTTAGLLGDYDAEFADLVSLPSTLAYAFWKDLTALRDLTMPVFSSGGGWMGAGTAVNPSSAYFDGSTGLGLGTILQGQTALTFAAWIKPTSPTTASTVILDSGGGSGNGLVLRQASNGSGKVDFIVGPEYTNYENLILSDSPVAYWRLGEGVGSSTAADISGANSCSGSPCDGTYSGGYTIGNTGAILGDADTQAHFNGVNAYVSLPQTFSFAGDFTEEAWVTLDLVLQSGVIFGTGSTNDDAFGGNSAANPYTFFACGTPGSAGTCTTVLTAATAPGQGLLHHVVLTRSGTTVNLYMDGVLDATGTSSDIIQVSRIGVGTRQTSPGLLRYLPGSVDEAALYDKALTLAEVKSHYEAGLSAKYMCRSSRALSSEWNQVTGSFDVTTGLASLYLNGALDCSYYSPADYDDSVNVTVGSTAANTNRWTGRVGDLKFYSSSAAATAYSAFDYTANRYRAQPLHQLYNSNLLFRIDAANAKDKVNVQSSGCGNAFWLDHSPYAANSALFGFNCTATSGWNGTGTTSDPYRLTFDGTNDFVDSFKSSADWNLYNSSTAKAVEVWAYLSGNTGVRPLFNIGDFVNNYIFQLRTDSATNTWTMHANAVAVTFTFDGHDKWAHYVLTSDGTTVRAYVNGSLLRTNGGNVFTEDSLTFTVGRNDGNNGTVATTYFKGDIAYTAVYNRDLVQAEVTALCNALKGRFAGVAGGVVCN